VESLPRGCQFVERVHGALALLIPRQLARDISRKKWAFVAQERLQPNVLGGDQMRERLPNRTLPNRKLLVQVVGSERPHSGKQQIIHPHAMLVQSADKGGSVHFDSIRSQ
jgi:hypothetical protein